jgi:phage tail sheath protein FI
MRITMPFQLSPGVAVVEKDFTSIVPAVSSSVGAFAGTFQWGPVLAPTTVSSENDLVSLFGRPSDAKAQSFFTAANFLSYTNNMLIVRADTINHRNAVVTQTGIVTAVTVSSGGSGYESTPTVTFSNPQTADGVTATGTAVMSGGSVTGIPIISGGSGYTSATVSIGAPQVAGGTQATATATVVDGSVTEITITNGGSGYTSAPTVTISGDGTNAIVGTVTISTSSVTSITIVNAGSGYTSAPTVTISAPVSGVTATATATITVGGIKINNSDDYLQNYSGGAGLVGEFAAQYPGSLGNSIKFSMMCCSDLFATWEYRGEFDSAPGTSDYAAGVSGVNDELHIIVIDIDGRWTGTPGGILEKFAFLSKASDAKKSDGTNNFYKDVINSRSEYLYWMDHPAVGTNWGQPAANTTFVSGTLTATLSGGIDDLTATDGQLQTSWGLFADDTQYDISLLPLGKVSSAVATYVINNVCETRLDCVAFISPEDIVTGDVVIGTGSAATNKIIAYRNALPSTSYAVMDSGFKYQYDRYNDKYRFIPLNGDIAGLCARTDFTNDPWFSPGGLNRGQIKNVVKLAVNPTKTDRDNLYKAGVNPVVTFPGEGTVLFGDKTLLAKPSAFDRINVRRLFIVMEKAIATAAKFQLFEFNDSFTRAQFKNLVEPFLRDVQGRRGITDFVVKCDETNNTGEVIDRNEFVADIFVKPNRSINFITLTFVAARSAINFTEIGA